MSKASKKTPIIKKKCSIKKLAEQYDLDASDYEELLKRIKLDIRRHKKIIKSKKSTKKDIEDSKRKLEGLLCSQAVLKERIYEEAGVSTETINKPKSASEEQKLINFLLSKAIKEPPQEKVKDEAEKKVEKLTPLTKADFYKKNTKDQKKDLDEALDKMEEIKKTITQKVIVTPVEKEELKLIKKEIAEVGSVRSSLNDPTVKVVPAVPAKPTTPAKPTIPAKPVIIPPATQSTVEYAKKKLKIKDLKAQLEKTINNSLEKETKLEEKVNNLKDELDDKIAQLDDLKSKIGTTLQKDNEFEKRILNLLENKIISKIIDEDVQYSNIYREIQNANDTLRLTPDEDVYIQNKTKFKELTSKLVKMLDRDIDESTPEIKNEISEIKNVTKDLKITKEKYKKEIDKLTNEINKKTLQLTNTTESLTNIRTDNEYLLKRNQLMSDELNKYENSTNILKKNLSELTEKIVKSDNEIDRLKNEISTSEETIKKLEDKLSSSIKPSDYRELKQDIDSKKEKIIELRKELKIKEEQINNLIDERDDNVKLAHELNNEYEGVLYKYNNLKKENESLSSKLDKAQETNDFISKKSDEYYSKISELSNEITKKNQIIEKNVDTLVSKKEVLENLKKVLYTDNNTSKELQIIIDNYMKEIRLLKKKYDDIVKTKGVESNETIEIGEHHNSLLTIVKPIRNQKKAVDESIEKLNEEIKKTNDEINQIEKETNRLVEDKSENQVEEQQIAKEAANTIVTNVIAKKEEEEDEEQTGPISPRIVSEERTEETISDYETPVDNISKAVLEKIPKEMEQKRLGKKLLSDLREDILERKERAKLTAEEESMREQQYVEGVEFSETNPEIYKDIRKLEVETMEALSKIKPVERQQPTERQKHASEIISSLSEIK